MANDVLSDADVGIGPELSDIDVGLAKPIDLSKSYAQPGQLDAQGRKPYAGYLSAGPFSPYNAENMQEAVNLYKSLGDPAIAIPRIRGTSTLGKLAAAPVNVAAGLAEGFESPLGLAATAVGGPVVKGLFAGLAAKEAGRALGEASVTRDPQQIAEGVLGAGLAPYMALHGTFGRGPEIRSTAEPVPPVIADQRLPMEPTISQEVEQSIQEPSEQDQIKGTSGVPVEQQSVTPDRPTEVQAQEGTAQRPSESVNLLPQPTQIQEVAPPEPDFETVEVGRFKSDSEAEKVMDEDVNHRSYRKVGDDYVVYEDRPKSTPQPAEVPQEIAPPSAPTPGVRQQVPSDVAAKGEGVAAPSPAPANVESGTPEAVSQPDVAPQPVAATPKGIGASIRTKWATATAEPLGGEGGFVNIEPLRELVEKATPYVRSAVNFVKDIGREEGALTKLGDYGKSVLLWSGKLQRSFSEASEAQKEIATKVPDKVKREGITNWIQAGGDPKVLNERMLSTHDPKLKAGYEAALKLTPEEVQVAKDAKAAFDALGLRGDVYDVLNNFKENYVTQIWDLGKGPVVGGARNLRNKFRFNKASTFPTYFDGEQAGYTPRTKDISKILPVYLHEMNFVIANRQLAEHLTEGTASDGRPLAEKIGDKPGEEDYRSIPGQPAIAGWKFHPEAFNRLKNILGKSAIREWYSTPTTALAQIPKKIVQGLDNWNSETKRTMLGLLAPFHQVQEGTHAVGHRVNPFFSIPKVDLVRDAAQHDATNHGLMLAPDRVSAEQFMEGFRTSGLVSKIPGIGKLADYYSNYLFHNYIPGLKYKTYQAILDRNTKLYEGELSSGKVSPADVKHLSAEQANAAYGHLNYVDFARNPTIQHIMQLGVLAPDFLESRARFTGQSIKGLTGAKVGREQLLALGTLAVGQAAAAYTSAKLSGGDWDPKRPFEFHVGNRRYTLRSVPEDISSLLHDSRAFAYSRISPIIGKGTAQYLSGTDYRGQKISAGQTTKELAQQMIPISIRGFAGLGRQSLSGWEQLASAVGLRISRYSPSSDVFDMAHKWMSTADPKTQKRLQIDQQSVFPESEYKTLRNALVDNNLSSAKTAYQELLKIKTPAQVYKALSHPHPFTGSSKTESEFVKSLTPDQKKIYDQTKQERRSVVERFTTMKSQPQ